MSTTLDNRYIDSSSWLGSYMAVDDLLSDTLMVSGIRWCPVIDELLYMLVNEWVWLKSRDCLLRPEVDIGAFLESELGQKWR